VQLLLWGGPPVAIISKDPWILNYVMFVDESGDHNLKAIDNERPLFCLTGCVFERRYYQNVVRPRFDALKCEFWGNTDVVFHSRDIRRHQKDFTILADPDLRRKFYEALNSLIADLQFTIIAIVLHKEDHLVRYGDHARNPYYWSLELLLERYTFLVARRGGKAATGYVLAESRGETEDRRLIDEYHRLQASSSSYNCDLRSITSLWTLKKTENIVGLQIADLAAYPIASKVLRPHSSQPAFDVLLPKIDAAPAGKGGGILGYGLKIVPQPTDEHLTLWANKKAWT